MAYHQPEITTSIKSINKIHKKAKVKITVHIIKSMEYWQKTKNLYILQL